MKKVKTIRTNKFGNMIRTKLNKGIRLESSLHHETMLMKSLTEGNPSFEEMMLIVKSWDELDKEIID